MIKKYIEYITKINILNELYEIKNCQDIQKCLKHF